jgi:hypothetical protein
VRVDDAAPQLRHLPAMADDLEEIEGGVLQSPDRADRVIAGIALRRSGIPACDDEIEAVGRLGVMANSFTLDDVAVLGQRVL